MINCPYCGRENPDNQVHCHECGTELHPYSDNEQGVFVSNPKAFRYWKLAAASTAVSIASLGAVLTWGSPKHPLQWALILLPSGIAIAIGMVAAVRCSLLAKGLAEHILATIAALANLFLLL